MPQVDMETLAFVCSSGSDRKIACETLADDEPADIPASSALADCPPESFWLSKDAEFDWFDRNAFLDRNESIKGNSNSMNLNLNSNSSSVHFSAFSKPKTANFISLPKAQKTIYTDSKRRNCKLANLLLFPKRSDSLDKSTAVASATEPSSPKVSCLGRVRSKRSRSRRTSNKPPIEPQKPAIKREKIGFISRVKSLFRCNRSSEKMKQSPECSVPRKNVAGSRRGTPAADPPVLGGVNRFSSGRRSETWCTAEMLS